MVKRLSKEDISRIQQLTREGKSLNQIMRITNLQKTTIYYHFLKIRGRTNIPVVVNESNKELVGEFIGLYAGDGSYFHDLKKGSHSIFLHCNKNDSQFIEAVITNVYEPLFSKKPRENDAGENRTTLRICSKEIYMFIREYLSWDPLQKKTYTVRLKSLNHSKEFFRGFIRGSLDSDGHCSHKQISFASVSKPLIDCILHGLTLFEFKYGLYKHVRNDGVRVPIYHIRVSLKERERFMKEIKPRNVKK